MRTRKNLSRISGAFGPRNSTQKEASLEAITDEDKNKSEKSLRTSFRKKTKRVKTLKAQEHNRLKPEKAGFFYKGLITKKGGW